MNKEEQLDRAIESVDRAYGGGSIMRMGDDPKPAEAIATGIEAIDTATGIGGIPVGRVVEIFGEVGSGRTSLVLALIASAQRQDKVVAYIDAEHDLSPKYATENGVDVASLLVSQPDCCEQGLEIADVLARSGAVDLIVMDSLDPLVSRHGIEEGITDTETGLKARLLSVALRKLTAAAARNRTTVVFINTTTSAMGVTFGGGATSAGSQALKFYSSMRIKLRRTRRISVPALEQAGHIVEVRIIKNKLAPPFRSCEVPLIFGHGYVPVCVCNDGPAPADGHLLCENCRGVTYNAMKSAGWVYAEGRAAE